MNQFKRAKILFLIGAIIFVYYFNFDYTLINIEKTAIIVSLGIDKSEEEYEATVQIAVPSSENHQASSQESVISAKGETLYGAVSKIGERTGWYPKLSFCDVIVLGKGILEDNVMNVIDFFLRSYKVEDSTVLCISDTTAKELLLSTSPLDNISGLSLSKVFMRDANSASRVLTTTIKDFSIGYYSNGNYAYIPVVKSIKTDDGGGATQTSSSGESGGGSSENQDLIIFDATESAIFFKGYYKGTLNPEQTLCYSLLKNKVNEEFLTINSVDNEGNIGKLLISILKNKKEIELIYENGKPILKISLKLWLKITDSDFSQNISELSKVGELNEKNFYDVSEFFKTTYLELQSVSKQTECDIYGVKDLLYRRNFTHFKQDYLTILDDYALKLDIQLYNYV